MKTDRFAAFLVALTLMAGSAVLAAEPAAGNAASKPKPQAGHAGD